jgi:rare lipoprotein A
MTVPAPPAPPALSGAPLAPFTLGAVTLAPGAPVRTELTASRYQLNLLENQSMSVTGMLRGPRRAPLARKVVLLQTLGRHGWRTVARDRTGPRGRFDVTFVPHELGSRLVRVEFAGDALDRPSRRRLGDLTVYREVQASWYGGGGGLACGGSLTSSTLGVANRTLPCGTEVTLHYAGRTVRVPVVDRGPFVEGREFDLTEATKAALGFGDTGAVWSSA